MSRYKNFIDYLNYEKLLSFHTTPLIVTGKHVSDALNMPTGPKVGIILHKVLSWQLNNPGKTKEDCLEWLKNL